METTVGRKPFATYFPGDGRTKQSHKDECDINKIVARARKRGFLDVNVRAGQFLDASSVPDYQGALAIVNRADQLFDTLDAKVRERFRNDPAVMIQWLSDPANKDEGIKLGLFKGPAATPPEPRKDASPEAAEDGGASSPADGK